MEPRETPPPVDPATAEPLPYRVQATAAPAAFATFLRDLAIVAAAVPIVIKLIGAKDLTGLLQWLQSSNGATVIAILTPIAVSGYRAFRSWRAKQELVTIARAAPNSVAVVIEKPTAPAA